MPETPSPGYGALAALLLFIIGSVWLGTLAQRAVQRGSFLKGYFLGNRGLGAWAMALTATVQSGGTFMGFPSLVYTHGWIVALWIASYMVVPITGFGVLGKRLAQLSRKTGAITVPDLFRERFGSPTVGLVASLLLLLFMTAMLIAQFKAGAIVMKISWPGTGALALSENTSNIDWLYYLGLGIFATTVVGYTLIGGFLAAVWTDLFQSVMMFIGVVLLFFLSLRAAGGLENASFQAMQNTSDLFVLGPGHSKDGREFLPLGLAVSFWVIWVFTGFGSPAGMVRIMASKNAGVIRRSMYLLSVYNFFIYLPLIVICICARAIMPDLAKSDEVIPRMALLTTQEFWGGSFLAGLILAAPFGAIMATVSGYLVVIASGLVRDIYQRFIDPEANEHTVRRLSYLVMILIGLVAVGLNLRPVSYLQVLVVFSGTGAAAAFVIPAFMICYWRRATAGGTMAAMLAGAGTIVAFYVIGLSSPDPKIGAVSDFRPYYLLGVDPLLWALGASLLAGVLGSMVTTPPDSQHVARLFDVVDENELVDGNSPSSR